MTAELFREDTYLRECTAVVVAVDVAVQAVILDRTVFYPLGGGQPGDTGVLIRADASELRIADTRKDRDSGRHLHLLAPDQPLPKVGEQLTARIDWQRRHRIMRLHSCLHLLSVVLPFGVTGGQISEDYARLDFDMPEPADKDQVEARLNALIRENHAARLQWISETELDANPALVKTLSVQPPRGAGRIRLVHFEGADVQPCGGTHVRTSAEIGAIRIRKIENKGKQNRRVIVEFAD